MERNVILNKLGRTLDIKTKYKTKFLIERLKEHRDNHINDYRKAMDVYHKDLKDALHSLHVLALKSVDTLDLDVVKTAHSKVQSIVKPVNAVKAYDQYIDLLFYSAEQVVELDMDDANSIINDEWDWAVSAKITNSFYSSRS